MKRILFCFSCLFLAFQAPGQEVTKVARDIAYYNKVDDVSIGLPLVFPPPISPGYALFEQLSKVATTEQLANYTKQSNGALATYAAWALFDQNYPDFITVFSFLMNNDKSISYQEGCMADPAFAADIVYSYISNKNSPNSNLMIHRLDSLIIFTHHTNITLLADALRKNQPNEYTQRIEFLAFTWNRVHALFYLYQRNRNNYQTKLKEGFVKYFNRASLQKNPQYDNERLIRILLEYRDPLINATIEQRLQRDNAWINQYGEIPNLLIAHGIKI